MFQGLSLVGTLGLVWIAIGAVLALLSRSPRILVLVAAASALANLSAYGLKLAVDRPRPPVRYAEPEPLLRVPADPSFPSGHATMSFACALLLTWSRPRLAPFLFALAAAVAWSRVYVGVHYPLDVLGGAALGLALATALRWLEGVPRRSGRRRRRG
ncbi:MAG: phosphatase PAP2 family protein [Gaiellaceae bacterium]